MAKKIHLNIPEPCHEDWDNMTPTEKGRFCGSCQKQVIDFTNMSDREVAQFFKKPSTGSVCGRFMQDQLERDIVIPRKRIPWVKYFFQVALPAFLATGKLAAQGEVKVKETASAAWREVKVEVKEKGKVKVDNVSQICKEVKQLGTQDRVGNLQRSILEDTIALPEVKVIGYGITTRGKVFLGYTTTKVSQVSQKSNIADSVIKSPANISAKNFNLYPNPVIGGQTFTIETLSDNDKIIRLTITDISGKVLLIQSRKILRGRNDIIINTGNEWATGTYMVVLSEENGKVIKQSKLVIQ